MIGLDTNLLIRIFIDDDPKQVAAARRLVADAAAGELLVSIIVLVEFVWTLQSHFKADKADIVRALEGLMTGSVFVIEDRPDVESALHKYKTYDCDLADCLIAFRNHRLGADRTVSIDRRAVRHSLFDLLAS